MAFTKMTDEEIIASYCSGDGSAFPLLYERYASRGMRYAYSLLKNENDSEEAVQETFCRLLNPLRRGAVDSKLGGFGAIYFKTLRNLSIDTLRSKSRRNHVPIEAVPEPGTERFEAAEGAPMEERVQALMETLPVNHGDALKLKVHGGLSYEQIAEILGCTRSQVRTWIYRARRSLEERLRREGLIEGKE